MARKWITAGVVLLALAVAGTALALASDDDSDSTRSAPSTNVLAPTTTPVTTAPSDTAVAPTTTAPSGGAPPGTCGAEAGAIGAAVDAGVPGARERAQVAECRLAAIDTTWALARLEAKPGAEFAATTVLLHGGGVWAIVDSGTDGVGCGKAPQQVLVDLGLFCAGTGGGIT